jgi:hypothetical protein
MRAQLSRFVRFLSLLTSAATILSSCNPLEKKAEPARKWDLFAADQVQHWKAADMPDAGKAEVRDGEAVISPGGPMSGLQYDNWERGGFPLRDYTVSYEAMRVDGGDFFAALIFPVRSIETCVTLIVGGWGGGLVGISSIDGDDASNNSTRSEQNFENGKWYRLKLEVRDDEIKAWIDNRIVINTSIKGRTIGLRPGYIEKCAPFGLATFGSTGRVRGLVVEDLQPVR